MSQITTTDNSNKQINSETDLQNLKKIADVKIKNLKLDDNPNLLVFPRDLNQYGDKISEQSIISLDGDKISTGNIMGFVGVNETQLDIRSRFAKDDGRDYFLHYMLQKVFAINLFDIKHTSNQEQIFEFLLYLFPYFLKKALAQGLFKKYQRFEHNDANLRGVIDVSRHIRQNIPFCGTVAYNTRQHSYDNHLTQLVRHTIEYIKTKPAGSCILNNDQETKSGVSQIIAATQSYNVFERQRIISQNLRLVRHPYFWEYTALQSLCLKVLRHENLKFGQEKDQVYGILFDGAWLWEEYLNTVLKPLGFKHPENKTGKGRKHLFTDNSGYCYPDFYNEDEKIVLDAKYKWYLEWKNVQTADLYQVITYMHILDYNVGGFIVPLEGATLKPKTLNGVGGTIHIIGVNVKHDCENFYTYAQKMTAEEKCLFE
ncbi:MAG: hypothetical protein II956_14955 [Bacteroidales bacterium]|nr:hypothetical protein [Bacteroidales bacterium]